MKTRSRTLRDTQKEGFGDISRGARVARESKGGGKPGYLLAEKSKRIGGQISNNRGGGKGAADRAAQPKENHKLAE